eukprot:5468118-Prymnesium_polylepis.1
MAQARHNARTRTGFEFKTARTRVGERKQLRSERLERLSDPGDIADEKRAPSDAVVPRTALHKPQQHGRPPRQEGIDDSVDEADHVLDRIAVRSGPLGSPLEFACGAVIDREHDQREWRVAADHRQQNVKQRQDPGPRPFKDVIGPP